MCIRDRSRVLDGSSMKPGDALVGLASSGVHSNGFSLVRKIFNISENNVHTYIDELGATLGETLLIPTKIYVKPVLEMVRKYNIKAISHITGGGFFENIPRMLQENCNAKIELASFPKLPIFNLLQKTGNIPQREMYNLSLIHI